MQTIQHAIPNGSDLIFNEPQSLNTKSVVVPQCRICLQDQSQTPNMMMIAPCLCTGSVKHVHFRCLADWIERDAESKGKKERWGQIQCGMCKSIIRFQLNRALKCKDKQRFKLSYQERKCAFYFLISVIIVCIGLEIISIYQSSVQNALTFQAETLFQSIILLTSIVFLALLIAFCVYLFIKNYIVQSKYTVNAIKSKPTIVKKRRQSLFETVVVLPISDEPPQMNQSMAGMRKASTVSNATLFAPQMIQDIP